MEKDKKDKKDNWYKEFCYEKDILRNAIKILKKYKTSPNLKHCPAHEVGFKFLEEFESNFILGQ